VAAGLATLRVLRDSEGFYSELEKKCLKLVKGLEGVAADAGLSVHVNRVGSMFQMFLTGEPVVDYASAKKSDSRRFMALHRKLLDSGVFVPPSQFESCFVSCAHSDDDLEKTVEAFEASLKGLEA
jgi:glutamate-1-semialdehyde 2,1-aminomutase